MDSDVEPACVRQPTSICHYLISFAFFFLNHIQSGVISKFRRAKIYLDSDGEDPYETDVGWGLFPCSFEMIRPD